MSFFATIAASVGGEASGDVIDWLADIAGGSIGQAIAIILILALITMELYRSSGRDDRRVVLALRLIIIPLLILFALGVAINIYAIVR